DALRHFSDAGLLLRHRIGGGNQRLPAARRAGARRRPSGPGGRAGGRPPGVGGGVPETALGPGKGRRARRTDPRPGSGPTSLEKAASRGGEGRAAGATLVGAAALPWKGVSERWSPPSSSTGRFSPRSFRSS